MKKAKKGQAAGVEAKARVLVVDLTKTQIAQDLGRGTPHLNEAEKALDGIDPQRYGLDAIAFVVRALPRGLAAPLIRVDDTRLSTADVKAMFGSRS